jgi:hypothetical protein
MTLVFEKISEGNVSLHLSSIVSNYCGFSTIEIMHYTGNVLPEESLVSKKFDMEGLN